MARGNFQVQIVRQNCFLTSIGSTSVENALSMGLMSRSLKLRAQEKEPHFPRRIERGVLREGYPKLFSERTETALFKTNSTRKFIEKVVRRSRLFSGANCLGLVEWAAQENEEPKRNFLKMRP